MIRLIHNVVARGMLLCMLLTMIAACGNRPLPSSGPSAAATVMTESSAATAEPVAATSMVPDPSTPAPREPASQRETILEVWYPFRGPNAPKHELYWKAFEESHPTIGIKAVFVSQDASGSPKLFTAIAGGTPPDVTWVGGGQVPEWAARGALEPLDDLIVGAGIKKEDFWEASWNQSVYNGKTWALPYSADPNYGLFWNKDMFKEAGLDPEKPPQTIKELDQMAEQLTRVTGDHIDQLGYSPFWGFAQTASMLTSGWVFGGEFYDSETNKVTANHPKNVAALEWMVSYNTKYGAKRLAAFLADASRREQHPFYQGRLAMGAFGSWAVLDLKRYAPNVQYGIAMLPTGPDGAPPHASWVSGWTVAIPKGAKHKEAAFEFIKWLTTSDEATTIEGTTFGLFPGYKQSPYYDQVRQDPQLKLFYEILGAAKHHPPVMPAQAFYSAALGQAVDAALFGQKTPKQALDDATAETQKELDRILAEGIK